VKGLIVVIPSASELSELPLEIHVARLQVKSEFEVLPFKNFHYVYASEYVSLLVIMLLVNSTLKLFLLLSRVE